MSEVLTELHHGHAPITLHHAFHDAIESFEEHGYGEEEPMVAWDGRLVRITSVFSRMLECTDLMPLRTRETLNAIARSQRKPAAVESGDVYARGASLMLALCADRYGVNGRQVERAG